MSLISVLISLAIESYWNKLDALRQYDWFESYSNWMNEKFSQIVFMESTIGVILVIAPVCAAVWLLESMFGGVLWLFGFAFGIAVLLYCLGPRSLATDAQAYLDAAEAGDHDLAKQHAESILGYETEEQEKKLADTVKKELLVQANDRLIGILFWFVLLGPVGAVLYRLSILLKQQTTFEAGEFAEASRNLYWIMNWLPARLCVVGYALAGNFIDTMSYWNSLSDFWLKDSEELLVTSGCGSLRQDLRADIQSNTEEFFINGVAHAISLIKRAVVVFLAILALMTLTGWVL
ncbi:MAG: regulatory signaling modulator protein AmpE [Gammaproteobacteria bacterium]|nr:regulatory signaling modulator protein AmpE [Gammaproteobacteria bacterium]MDH5777040.1 regulatory signaling modulator protein AmpE [Gammaproteobacteria bacterium]